MRGDEPEFKASLLIEDLMYPTCEGMNCGAEAAGAAIGTMYPTCVGMNRRVEFTLNEGFDVPHMRGDEPYATLQDNTINQCTPHAWG